MNSILTEYDEEQVLADIGQEKYEEGREAGMRAGMRAGKEAGMKAGMDVGINAFILDNVEDGKSEEQILEKLTKRFSLAYGDAKKYYDTCVKVGKDCKEQ